MAPDSHHECKIQMLRMSVVKFVVGINAFVHQILIVDFSFSGCSGELSEKRHIDKKAMKCRFILVVSLIFLPLSTLLNPSLSAS